VTPLCQGGGAIEFESFAVVKMTLLIEMIVDRRMGSDEFLEDLYIPEPRHCTFSSSEWLV
jgi:hypothetical protein